LALKAGFDKVLFKPVALTEIQAVLASVVHVVALANQAPQRTNKRASPRTERRLPIKGSAKNQEGSPIKNPYSSRSEAAICEGIIRFQEEYLGGGAEQIRVHLIKDLLVVRLQGALTVAERQLANSLSPERGRISSS